MSYPALLKVILCFSGIVVYTDCQSSCWPDVHEQEAGVSLAFDTRSFDTERLLEERSELRSALQRCSERMELYYTLPDDHITGGTISILSMVIAADDPALTKKFVESLNHAGLIEPDDLMYGGQYIQLAAHYEAANALRVLLDTGIELSGVSAQSMEEALFNARVFTPSGLKVIRMLIEAGASVNATSPRGHTPIEGAAAHGDLAKIQCLYSFGAPLPPSSIPEKRIAHEFVLDSPEALLKTIAFLNSPEKTIPKSISQICSFGMN